VGPILGYGAIILFCVITGEFGKLVLGLILMAIIMFIDGNVINPKLLSASVEVHPLLVVAALIAGGAVGGFLGMIIAVPTAALIKLYFERFLVKREQSLAAAESKKE
jgi:predicted PurR-regulated permease PerM